MNSPPLTTHHSPLTEALCHRLTYAAILLLIILAYSPFLGNYFVQDDFTWLEVAVWSSRDITRIFTLHIAHFFMPLGHLVFLIEYRLFGLDPFGYSLVNLALHALNCVLLFHLARRITQNDSVGLIAAILFACNSSHFHGVVWISALPRLILTALMLAALLAFDSYLRTRHRTWYALSLLFCVGAMLSKEQCVVLAPLLLLHQALFDPSREGTSWRRYRCLVPHLALFAAYLAVEVPLQQHSRLLTEGRYAPGLHLPAVLSALTALGGLFVPRELVPPAIMPPLLLLIAVAVLVTVALAARSPQFPARPAIYGLIWAFVGLIPGSFFKQAQIVAHRLTYIPAVGHAVLLAVLAMALAALNLSRPLVRGLVALFVLGMVVVNLLVLDDMATSWRARCEQTHMMKAALDFYHARGLFGGPEKRLTFLAGTPAYSDHLVSLLYVLYGVSPNRVETDVFVPKDDQANLTSSPGRLILWWNAATQTLVKL